MWAEVFTGVAALLGCDVVIRLLFFRASKREATAVAEGVEKQNEGTAVETLKTAMQMLQEQLSEANNSIEKKDTTIASLRDEVEAKNLRLQALYDDMCVHKGCKLRRPHQGQGAKWYDEHADDPSLGCDYLSVEWLLKQWRARNAGVLTTETEEA